MTFPFLHSSSFLPPPKPTNIIKFKIFYVKYLSISHSPASTIMNSLLNLLKLYPRAQWNWKIVTRNPNTNINTVLDHPELPWDKRELSANPSTTWSHVRSDILEHVNWNISKLARHVHDVDALLSYEERIHNIDSVPVYKETPSIFHSLSFNPCVDILMVKAYIKMPWDFHALSANSGIRFEDVKTNPDLPWDGKQLSKNPNVYMNDIIDNPKIKWDIPTFCANPNFDWLDIYRYPRKNWCHNTLSYHPKTTLDVINRYRHIFYKCEELVYNPNLNYDYIKENLIDILDHKVMASQPYITAKNVMYDPLLRKHGHSLSANPSMDDRVICDTMGIIDWNFEALSGNLFKFHPYFKSVEH